MYERSWVVRFSDTDPFGVAHYPRIIDAIHDTSDMFMQELGFPYWEIISERGFGFPIVKMDFEFESPIESGDDISIQLRPATGNSSVQFEYVAKRNESVVFFGEEQRVCVQVNDKEVMEIPDDIRNAFHEYENE